jgi:hypothetical protein
VTALLLLKLLITPSLVLGISLAARRWGPSIAGWLGGLPVSAGPVSLFLAIEQGVPFAASAAPGALAGLCATTLCCLAYARLCVYAAWPWAFTGAALVFFAGLAFWQWLGFTFATVLPAVLASIFLTTRFYPQADHSLSKARPRFDLPMRLGAAMLLLIVVTGFANMLGPQVSGLLTTFPVVAPVLAVFAQRAQGPGAVSALLRSLVLGLPSTVAFFVVICIGLPSLGMTKGYSAALAVALAVQALSSVWRPRVAIATKIDALSPRTEAKP